MNYSKDYEKQTGLRVVIFGGGGGGSVMTRGLAEAMPEANITTIVPTGDSGSKTGELRELFGGPAVGDARKNLGAVASAPAARFFSDAVGRFGPAASSDDIRRLNDEFLEVAAGNCSALGHAAAVFEDVTALARWLPDGLCGHTYANLVLTALRLRYGQLTRAIYEIAQWVGVPANVRILPVTEESYNVVMHDKTMNKILVGEKYIDEYVPVDARKVDVWLESGPLVNREITAAAEVAAYLESRAGRRAPQSTPAARNSIAVSDVVMLAPGSPWTSHVPVLMPRGVREALHSQQSHDGLWAMFANLIEEKPGLTLATHLSMVQRITGRPVTHLVYNTALDELPKGTVPLLFDPLAFDVSGTAVIGGSLVDSYAKAEGENDPIAHLRSPGRHDAWRTVEIVQRRIMADLYRAHFV